MSTSINPIKFEAVPEFSDKKLAPQYIVTALKKAGAPSDKIPLLLAQIATETGNFTDRKLREYNNAGGLTYSKSFYDPKDGVTAGRVLPEAPKYRYAIFPTFSIYLKYYLKILRRKPQEPIKATTAADFITRLKAQNYFSGSADEYLKNVQFWLKRYINLKPAPVAATLLLVIVAIALLK